MITTDIATPTASDLVFLLLRSIALEVAFLKQYLNILLHFRNGRSMMDAWNKAQQH